MENSEKSGSPTLIARSCGGWLAVSNAEDSLKIGVSADTEEEAREAFERAVLEWCRLTEQADV